MRYTLHFVLSIIFASSFYTSMAQCPTVPTPQQKEWLARVQSEIQQGIRYKNTRKKFVPVKIHIVGNAQGKGFMNPAIAMSNICALNIHFNDAGMYFYMPEAINFISDNDLYQGLPEAIYSTAADAKVPDMLNIFYTGTAPGWCGVYYPWPDIVLLQIACAQPGNSTLTHEVGHFFGLPHTFLGWEGGNTPPISNQERVDRLNCRTSADGFCDTYPDYVSYRWGCVFSGFLTDPTGAQFKPDGTNYMSYAADNCHNRFSDEQMQAMNQQLSIERGWDFPVQDTFIQAVTTPIFPANGDSLLNPDQVSLHWTKVPGAIGYLVQVARFSYWPVLNINQTVWSDTSLEVALFGEWPYGWRVQALFPGNLCAPFSATGTFSTKPLPTSLSSVSALPQPVLFPNPVGTDGMLHVQVAGSCILRLFTIDGKVVVQQDIEAGTHEIVLEHKGEYVLEVKSNEVTWVGKVIY